jgi:hypothetical protein
LTMTYRSSSGALNCICSLWFIYTCGDRSLTVTYRSSSGALNCICSPWFI